MKIISGINGFGRFGLHLLKYYLDRYDKSNFQIAYINDDFLSIEEVIEMVRNDNYVEFRRYKVPLEDIQKGFEAAYDKSSGSLKVPVEI